MNTHFKVLGRTLELCNAFGFLYPAELFLIQAIANTLPPEAVCVNIGAGVGTGSLALREIRPDLQLFTVDISKGGPEGGLQNEINAFNNAHYSEYPTQMLGNSQEKWKDWNKISGKKKIDYLFIDGDHAETALQGDIDGWTPFVKVGGFCLFHDYGSDNWGDVSRVVDENMQNAKWRYILHTDTLIAFQRTGAK